MCDSPQTNFVIYDPELFSAFSTIFSEREALLGEFFDVWFNLLILILLASLLFAQIQMDSRSQYYVTTVHEGELMGLNLLHFR